MAVLFHLTDQAGVAVYPDAPSSLCFSQNILDVYINPAMAYCGPCNAPPLVCTQPCYQTEVVGATGPTGPTGTAPLQSVNFTVGYRGSANTLAFGAAPALLTFAQNGTTQAAIGVGLSSWNAGSATFVAPQAGVYTVTLNCILAPAAGTGLFSLWYAINDVPILSNWNGIAIPTTTVPLVATIPLTLNAGDRVYLLGSCTVINMPVFANTLTVQSIGF